MNDTTKQTTEQTPEQTTLPVQDAGLAWDASKDPGVTGYAVYQDTTTVADAPEVPEVDPDNDEITQDDLDTVARVTRIADEMWPLYAEGQKITDPSRWYFMGIDDDLDAVFVATFGGEEDRQYMPLSYLLDKSGLIAQARRVREEREAAERARAEAARAAEAQRRAAERARQQAADLAAYHRVKDLIARGEINPDA